MPFRSEAQRRFLWATHPKIAEAWAHGKHTTKGKGRRMPKKDGPGVHHRKVVAAGKKLRKRS